MALLSLNKAYQALKKRAKDFAKEQGAVTAVEFGLSFGIYIAALMTVLEMARYIWISGLIDYAFEKSVLKVKNAPATFNPSDFYEEFVTNLRELNKDSIGLFAMDPEPLSQENVNIMKFFRIGDLTEFLRNDPAGSVFTSMSGWTCSAEPLKTAGTQKHGGLVAPPESQVDGNLDLLKATYIPGSSPCLYKAFFQEKNNWTNGNRNKNSLPWEYSGFDTDNNPEYKYTGLTTLGVIYKYKTLIPLPFINAAIGNITRGTVQVVESKLALNNSMYEQRIQPTANDFPNIKKQPSNTSSTSTTQTPAPVAPPPPPSKPAATPKPPAKKPGAAKPGKRPQRKKKKP